MKSLSDQILRVDVACRRSRLANAPYLDPLKDSADPVYVLEAGWACSDWWTVKEVIDQRD
jgi:hypothetical protein